MKRLLLAVPVACAAAHPAPARIDGLPQGVEKVYALGYCGPSFDTAAAVRSAGDDAIGKLAASLRGLPEAYSFLVERASGLTVAQFAKTLHPDDAFLAIVRERAKVEATWVEGKGARPSEAPGAAWAMASIEVPSSGRAPIPIDNPDIVPSLGLR
jgi:hypothetical protein